MEFHLSGKTKAGRSGATAAKPMDKTLLVFGVKSSTSEKTKTERSEMTARKSMDNALLAFGAMTSKTRVVILERIVESGEKGMTSGEIVSATKSSPNSASIALKNLRLSGLIDSARKRQNVVHRPTDKGRAILELFNTFV